MPNKSFAGIALAEYVMAKTADRNYELAETAVYTFLVAQGWPESRGTLVEAIGRVSSVLGADEELSTRDVYRRIVEASA